MATSLRAWVPFLSLWVFVAGCAAGGAAPTPVSDPAKRLELPGFSILPPSGENWLHVSPSALPATGPGFVYKAMFVTKLRETPPQTAAEELSLFAAAAVLDLRERKFNTPTDFLKFVESADAVGMMASPHRLLGSKASVLARSDATCVTHHQAEDTGVRGSSGATFLVTIRGVACLHPQWPRYAVFVSSSERHLSGQKPVPFEADVEPFLKSLVFTPARPLPPFRVTKLRLGGLFLPAVAVDERSVWITRVGRPATLIRLDPRTHRMMGQVSLGLNPPWALVIGPDAVWAATGGQQGSRLLRIDPETGSVVASIAVGEDVVEQARLAVGEGSVWMTTGAGDGRLLRIDPATNEVVARIPVGSKSTGLAVGEGAVWVASLDDDSLVRVDPRTNAVVTRIRIGGNPEAVTTGEGGVWVASPRGYRRVLGAWLPTPAAMFTDSEGTVSRIDPSTNRVVATIGVRKVPVAVAVGEGAVWVANFESENVSRIDPRTNQVTDLRIELDDAPVSLAVGHGAVWGSTRFKKSVGPPKLFRIDP